MNSLIEAIKARGYWQVVIRPTEFQENRIEDYATLFPFVQSLSLRVGGWDFPHIDRNLRIENGSDWVGQICDFDYHKETWRIYQSGQFAFFGAFWLDWVDDFTHFSRKPPKSPLHLVGTLDTVRQFTVFLKFAAALARSDAISEDVHVEVACHGVKDRELWVDSPSRFDWDDLMGRPTTGMDEIERVGVLHNDETDDRAHAMAIDWSVEFFKRFNWDVNHATLGEMQESVLEYVR